MDIDTIRDKINSSDDYQFSLIIWESSYPGYEKLSSWIEDLEIELGLEIRWEDISAPNTVKCELIFSWE